MKLSLSPLRRTALPVALAAIAARLFGAADTTASPHPLMPRTGLPPFQYQDASDRLPNYLPGEKWGTQGQVITQMQAPLSPEESARHIVVQPGFAAQLWASEPQIVKPIALAWDVRGRLWIAETVDYPNNQQPDGEGNDRIKICEDTDGDGRADKFTVFAEHLSIPRSLVFAQGGLIVLEGNRTLFLKDTNGDDVADESRVLFSGWGMGDTHATGSNLRYGYDGWIWGTVGYSGFKGTVGGKAIEFSSGVYRFRPDGSALEFIRSSNNNTWGLGLSEEGLVFGSTANNNASWYLAIPNRYYERVQGWAASVMGTIADSQQFYPITTKIRQVDAHGHYTAGAGHALYTGRAFPQEYWNRAAFVAEPTGHLVGWFRLEGNGADFKAVNQGSFLASDDEWTAPIVAEVGPDGAVWVIDWYNYIVQHNPVPNGFKNGKGNAYDTSLRDKRHGRIYRVSPTGAKATAAPKLAGASGPELVAALKADTQLMRLHAQRLLIERGDKDVVPALVALTQETSVDALGLNVGAIHALHTLQGLSEVPEAMAAAVSALKHPSAGVRRAAVSTLPRVGAVVVPLLASGVLTDPQPQVRLATLLTLADMPDHRKIGPAVYDALSVPENVGDRWLRDALVAAGAAHISTFGRSMLRETNSLSAGGLAVIRQISQHVANHSQIVVSGVISQLQGVSPKQAEAILAGFSAGWPEGEKLNRPAKPLGLVVDSLSDTAQADFLQLAQKWGLIGEFPEMLERVSTKTQATIQRGDASESDRIAAAKALVRFADSPPNIASILAEVTPTSPPALATGLLEAIGNSHSPGTGATLLSSWKKLAPAGRRTVVSQLLRRPEWSDALLEAIAKGELLRGDLGPQQWQQLVQSGDAARAARARELRTPGTGLSADREAVVKQFLPAAAKTGDLARGREVFTANCAVCHKIDGVGQSIGPDLSGIGARTKADILTEVLDPNRSVEANYRLWNVVTKAGETIAGRLDGESATSIELTDLTGHRHTLPRSDLAGLESSNQSIMPAGFESLGGSDLASLLEFLAAAKH